MPLAFYLKGFGLGGGLIIAIGSQNAHVLRMGLRRQHVGLTVLVCIVCEIALISAGVAGMGAVIGGNAALLASARWGGAAFLLWYGLRAWRAALSSDVLVTGADAPACSTRRALTTVLMLTLLNPHVYLDTVILLGSIGGQQPGNGRLWFALGAISAATVWFVALGFGARLLAPLFARPVTWRMLDFVIGVVMFGLAGSLIAGGPM
ncbi:amino acid transporter [Noviherbaspirillum cavernae]|uniref:Amino acid transporter n=1 Tax=Noviherbaspirillum cavernae TaxID=2320862 RepID=A0A418X5H6_9BURK|nr:LysE/ArgO family amino acid transporter [Noviherbaspirillum cavernae]RJG07738.1 amino acid transporter [Noviherbaspirillum cavernae]